MSNQEISEKLFSSRLTTLTVATSNKFQLLITLQIFIPSIGAMRY